MWMILPSIVKIRSGFVGLGRKRIGRGKYDWEK